MLPVDIHLLIDERNRGEEPRRNAMPLTPTGKKDRSSLRQRLPTLEAEAREAAEVPIGFQLILY